MRLCTTAYETVRRTWTVELRPQRDGPALHCPHCTLGTTTVPPASARSTVLAHLARHARRAVLPAHLGPASAVSTAATGTHATAAAPARSFSPSPANTAAAPGASPTPAPPAPQPPRTRPSSPRPQSPPRSTGRRPLATVRAGEDFAAEDPAACPSNSASRKCSATSPPPSPTVQAPGHGCSPLSAPCAPVTADKPTCLPGSCAACACSTTQPRGKNWKQPAGYAP